jgi:hypothetical protein
MQPQTPPATAPVRRRQKPTLKHWFAHVGKTLRLLWSLLRDPRVSVFRKIAFIGLIIIFGVVLFIPDSLIVGALALLLPALSPFVGVPEGVIDVAALAFVLYWTLRIFPQDVVQDNAERLYGPEPDIRPHTKAA